FVLQGLQGGADGFISAADGRVTAGKLLTFLLGKVPQRTSELRLSTQTPVVSPDFDAGYVLTLAPVVPPSEEASGRVATLNNQLQALRETNPELALMVFLGAIQSKIHFGGPQNEFPSLRNYFDGARARKTGGVKVPQNLETLLGPTISSSGKLFLGCT